MQVLINIGYKDFISYSKITITPCSRPTNEDIIQMLLNLGFNIKESMLWVFFFIYFLENERKESHIPQTSCLILEANKTNSSTTPKSFSSKLSKEGTTSFFFLINCIM